MVTFDYVASALGFGVIRPDILAVEQKEEIKKTLGQLTAILQLRFAVHCKNVKSTFSGLFNAWTEEDLVDLLRYLGDFNLRSMYADSGGLQIVTAGKTITEELKDKVYGVQCYADFAMCFDDIPLESDASERNRNERSNLFNKIFMREKHVDAAKSTAVNIKRQIAIFRERGAKTKVFLIAHGNNSEDMLTYYRAAADILTEDDYKYVGGLAFSKMCIGTGDLENIEMMRGAHLISKECHPNVHKHLHILGAGSLDRLRPAIYLIRSGYLNKFKKFSTDSSSHTSCFDYGLLKTNGGCVSLGQYRTEEAEKHFLDVYNMFAKALKNLVTYEEFLQYIFAGGKFAQWSYSVIRDRALTSKDDNRIIVAYIIKTLHTYFQIENFVMNVDKIWGETSANGRNALINQLQKLQNDDDMNEWFNEFSREVVSNRVRDEDWNAYSRNMTRIRNAY